MEEHIRKIFSLLPEVNSSEDEIEPKRSRLITLKQSAEDVIVAKNVEVTSPSAFSKSTNTHCKGENEESVDKLSDSSSVNDVAKSSRQAERNCAADSSGKGPTYHTINVEKTFRNSGFGWNEEMEKFYNSTWNGENFDVPKILKGMESNKEFWKINTADQTAKVSPPTKLRCYNCCSCDHTTSNCERPKKPQVCIICGVSGHEKKTCPNAICMKCGNKSASFGVLCRSCPADGTAVCPICKSSGHTVHSFLQKWRRYDSTATSNTDSHNAKLPNEDQKSCTYRKVGMCHYAATYSKRCLGLEYPVTDTPVPQKGISLKLLYNPNDHAKLPLAENITPTGYYGRFLNAVGMHRSLGRKRPNVDTDESEVPTKQPKDISNIKNLVCSATVTVASDQVQDISASDNINSTVESSAKNLPIDVAEMLNCSEISGTNNCDEEHLDLSPTSSKKIGAVLALNTKGKAKDAFHSE